MIAVGVLSACAAHADDTALVVRINGAPTVVRAGKSQPLHRGDIVSPGDTVDTDAASKVKILLADDSVLAIGPRSRVTLQDFLLAPQNRTVHLEVLAGRFKIAIAKFFGGTTSYTVRTPTALAGVRGTVLWGDTDLDAICALEGTVDVRPLKEAATPAQLTTGECVHQMGSGRTAPFAPSQQDLSAYLREVTLD
jgi:hypothetical protein